MICVAAGGKIAQIAATAFTLSWTHSVEKTTWTEHWQVVPAGLIVTRAEIAGSGAGMEPPPDAVLRDGGYVYEPHVPPVERLVLAASGMTEGGWTLCAPGAGCRELGRAALHPIAVERCDA